MLAREHDAKHTRMREMGWLPTEDCDSRWLGTFRDDGTGRAEFHCRGKGRGARKVGETGA
jgi:hypothetical protein